MTEQEQVRTSFLLSYLEVLQQDTTENRDNIERIKKVIEQELNINQG